jgi:hypothetical protein
MRFTSPILAALLATGACQQADTAANDNITVSDMPEQPGESAPANGPTQAPPPPTANTVDPSVPPPVHLDPDAPPIASDTSAQGAVRRALEYCDALATRRFGDAYRLWSNDGKASGLTQREFTAKFANVRISDCQFRDPGPIEGAAGSLFVEVPAVIRGTTDAGRPLRIEGPIVLRRVNDVDGSTAEQRRWHIARAEFPVG